MTNLDIIKQFDATEMAKFIAAAAIQKWYDYTEIRDWLLLESEDGFLYKGYMVWRNQQWEFDETKRGNIKTDNWILLHIPDILEFILAADKVKSHNVLVVIPAIEYGHRYDNYSDIIHYKGINFTIWSDFFDYRQEEIKDIKEGEEDYKRYLDTFNLVNFMKNYEDLASTIKVYFKDK